MSFISSIFARARMHARPELRSAPTSWDLLRTGVDYGSDAGVWVSPYLAENLSVVFACVQVISETVAMLPLHVYRKLPNGDRAEEPGHPVAQLFSGDPNERQTGAELIEMLMGHCLLRGNSYAEIIRDGRGAPVGLDPFHPDWVSVVLIPRTNRIAYDVTIPMMGGPRRRILAEEMLHLKDRSDDGVIGKSRLARARETFGSALATERYAASTFRNGASMSGVLSHPEALGEDAAERLRKSFEQTYSGSDKAGKVAVLEEGLKWQQVSVSPDDAQMLESRKFSVEALARIYRVPGPVINDFQGGNYSSISEVGRWFYSHTILPWLNKLERLIERSLLSSTARRSFEVEFDCDLLLRGDMLQRFQSYRIAREIGMYSANELRRFEHANRRTDPAGDEYLTPTNLQPEQTGRPAADRGGGSAAAA
jgi:HK97 family phage portal protein